VPGPRNLLDFNLGSWMNTYFGHDGAYILDPANEPLFRVLRSVIVCRAMTPKHRYESLGGFEILYVSLRQTGPIS